MNSDTPQIPVAANPLADHPGDFRSFEERAADFDSYQLPADIKTLGAAQRPGYRAFAGNSPAITLPPIDEAHPPADPDSVLRCVLCEQRCLNYGGLSHCCHRTIVNFDFFLFDLSKAPDMAALGKTRAPRSQFKNVQWRPNCKKWEASCRYRRKLYFLGHYAADTDAAHIVDNFLYYLWRSGARGECPSLNFPDNYSDPLSAPFMLPRVAQALKKAGLEIA